MFGCCVVKGPAVVCGLTGDIDVAIHVFLAATICPVGQLKLTDVSARLVYVCVFCVVSFDGTGHTQGAKSTPAAVRQLQVEVQRLRQRSAQAHAKEEKHKSDMSHMQR